MKMQLLIDLQALLIRSFQEIHTTLYVYATGLPRVMLLATLFP